MMQEVTIEELVKWLTPPEQVAVRAFVSYLREQVESEEASDPSLRFMSVARRVMAEHRELLRRLAQ
jgi:hypothetical protein